MRTLPRILLLALTLLLVYSFALPNPFYFDDLILIRDNGWIQAPRPVSAWFSSFVLNGDLSFRGFRPFLMLSFWLNARLLGDSPEAFRSVNISLHLLNVLLLATLVQRLSRNSGKTYLAWWTGILFALHPLQTVAVNFLWKRSSLLESALVLLSLHVHVSWRESGKGGISRILAVWSLYGCALGAKESALLLPLLLAAADLLLFSRPGRRSRMTSVYYTGLTVLSALYVWVRFVRLPAGTSSWLLSVPDQRTLESLPYVMQSLRSLPVYLLQLLIPSPRILDDPLPVSEFPLFGIVLLLFGLGGSVVIGFRARGEPLLSLFLFWFWLAILSTMVLPLYLVFDSIRLYPLSAALSFFVSSAALRWNQRSDPNPVGISLPSVLIALLAVSYGTSSLLQNLRFRHPERIWGDVVRAYPESDIAWEHLGAALEKLGAYREAGSAFATAFRINPTRWGRRVQELHSHLHQGSSPDKIRHELNAIPRNRLLLSDFATLANVYREIGDLQTALDLLRQVVRANPSFGPAYAQIGFILEQAGKTEEARNSYMQALLHRPNDPNSREGIRRLEERGRWIPPSE